MNHNSKAGARGFFSSLLTAVLVPYLTNVLDRGGLVPQNCPVAWFRSTLGDPVDKERERLLRAYAVGDITWTALRERGFDNYVQVLGGLGELGLRQPVAAMEGPNVAARQRGRAIIRNALLEASKALPS